MITFGLTFVMYITPVVYMIPEKPGLLKTIMTYNPFTPLLITSRDWLTGQSPEHLTAFLITLLCCMPLLLIALVFYRLSIPIIVERLSA
jgi:lipopolysaccharide transport system permease protein